MNAREPLDAAAGKGADGHDDGRYDDAGFVAALAGLEGMGPVRLRRLLASRPPESLWRGLADRSERVVALQVAPAALVDSWCASAAGSPEVPAAMGSRLRSLGVEVLRGSVLPQRLRADLDPPGALFVAGSPLTPEAASAVAVVGTRRASDYGLRVARSLGSELASAGVSVVSGLATGIDAAAHAGALAAEVGAAGHVAVIGAGHDRPCPVRNRALARAISGRGSVIGEVPPGVASAPWRYPVRNRLIAALADVVVVVESGSAGGSMSTVSEALARDRVVMAVPGPVGRRSSEGCHDLIRDGAGICTAASDVIEALGLLGRPPRAPSAPTSLVGPATLRPSAHGHDVLEALAEEPLAIESLASRTSMSLGELSEVLCELGSAGLVTCGAGWVRRTGANRHHPQW
ncbi:MAG: DNA-processing protein DprA [Microthrixaceae bacterium]